MIKKRITVFLITVLFIACVAPISLAAGYDYTLPSGNNINASPGAKGDVTGDSMLSLKDVSMMFQWWNGASVSLDFAKFDFNHDGASDLRDAAALFRFCGGNFISSPDFSAEITGNTLNLTVSNASPGKEYLLICRLGKEDNLTLSEDEVGKIIFIDQKKAAAGTVSFCFSVPKGTTVFSAFVSSTDSAVGQKAYLTIPG